MVTAVRCGQPAAKTDGRTSGDRNSMAIDGEQYRAPSPKHNPCADHNGPKEGKQCRLTPFLDQTLGGPIRIPRLIEEGRHLSTTAPPAAATKHANQSQQQQETSRRNIKTRVRYVHGH
jgi:hypothetical protein